MPVKKILKIHHIIKDTIKGLDHEIRWKIVEILINNGEMTYTELKNKLKIENKGILNFHLNILSSHGIITRSKYLKDDLKGKSYYNISYLGKRIIEGIIFSLDTNNSLSISQAPSWIVNAKNIDSLWHTSLRHSNIGNINTDIALDQTHKKEIKFKQVSTGSNTMLLYNVIN